ncbi:MAG: cytochrome c-type biosis protein CcmH [Bryobacterales bacterium]|jgi:cytochrome c-type biogenesis protein CcmH/NrfF|nr:cytochrome c-type biosis protein CcmH [Bryobacterales bacterium]
MKRVFLLFVLVCAALAQTESEIESDSVRRVGTHIACQCGACSENVNCNMSSGQCHFCKPARTKIYKMQRAGMSDDQVIAGFITEYGKSIFRADPNSFFWMVPYLSLLAGAGVLWLVLKKMRGGKPMTPAPAGPAIDDPVLAKYRAAIEKDTDKLD